MSFCGSCGQHWDRNTKTRPAQPNKPKGKKPEVEAKVAEEFSMPSVGLPIGSQGSSLQPAASIQQQQPVSKPLKTLLHQKANRIGKLENRIAKLKSAIRQVQQDWPAYVHKLQQHMQQEYQKCVTFTQQAQKELQELQLELQEVVSSQMVQPACPSPPPATGYAAAPVLDPQQLQQVQAAIDALSAAGLLQSQTLEHTQMSMDTDHYGHPAQQMEPSPLCQSGSHMPNIPGVQIPELQPMQPMHPLSVQIPVLPVVSQPSVGPQVEVSQPEPPGQWGWPPAPPQLPSLHLESPVPDDTPEMFANPLYRKPVLPVPAPQMQSAVPDPAPVQVPQYAPQVQQAVNQAAQGLQDLCQQQGLGDGHSLPPEFQEQLARFAAQQQECHAKMQAMQQTALNKPQGKPVALGPFPNRPVDHASKTTVHATNGSWDGLSVHSSPMKQTHTKGPDPAERYSLSPPGQRETKIPKSIIGDIHSQQGLGLISDSPIASPRTPTPVPTEVPTEVAETPNQDVEPLAQCEGFAPQALQQLE